MVNAPPPPTPNPSPPISSSKVRFQCFCQCDTIHDKCLRFMFHPTFLQCMVYVFYTRRDGRGLTRILTFDPCLTCVIRKLMAVFFVRSVLEHQQQQLDLPQSRSWAVLDQDKRYCPGQGRRHRASITAQVSSCCMGHSPCWVISLAFGHAA